MQEKMGTIIFDGKIYNMDMMSNEEMSELEIKIDKKQEEIMQKIEDMLNQDDDI